MKISDIKGTYRCDARGHTFKGSKIKLKSFGKGFSLPQNRIMVVEPDGTICGKINPNAEDKILYCPICDTPQLFGFDKVN